MIRQKKAQEIFSIVILIAFLYLLFTAVSRPAETQKKTGDIGELSLEIKERYDESEKDLLYIDQAAEYSSYISAYDLALNGGFTRLGSACGSYKGYNLWNTAEKECYPDYANSFSAYFSQYMPSYLKEYPERDISDDYSIQIIGSNVIGMPGSGINYAFSQGNYIIRPSFSVHLDHEVDDFDHLIDDAKELISLCNSSEEKKRCITENLPEKWELGGCGSEDVDGTSKFRFCIKAGAYYPLYDKELYHKELMYRFALSFE